MPKHRIRHAYRRVRRAFHRRRKMTAAERLEKPLQGVVAPTLGLAAGVTVLTATPAGYNGVPLFLAAQHALAGDTALAGQDVQAFAAAAPAGAVAAIPAIAGAAIAAWAGRKLHI